MPWASKYAARTAQLRTAQAALNRYQNRGWARKADNLPDFDRQQQRRQDRADLVEAVKVLGPIIEARVAKEVELDRAEKAEAYPYNGPGQLHPSQRIGEVAVPSRGAAGELEVFKTQVSDILQSSPDSGAARRRIQLLLAQEASRLTLKGGGR